MDNISILKNLYKNQLFEAVYITDGDGIFTISNSDISYRSDQFNSYYTYSELFDIASLPNECFDSSGVVKLLKKEYPVRKNSTHYFYINIGFKYFKRGLIYQRYNEGFITKEFYLKVH